MLAMASQIEIYEEMSALSARMVEAARSHEWDRLIDLEAAVAALRNTLMNDASATTVLSSADQARKAALIQKILADDAEVRRYTDPWMERVRHFLGRNNQRKKIEHAYGAGLMPDRSRY